MMAYPSKFQVLLLGVKTDDNILLDIGNVSIDVVSSDTLLGITIDLFTERKACWENGGDLEISTPRSFEFRQVLRCLFSQQTSLPMHEQRC